MLTKKSNIVKSKVSKVPLNCYRNVEERTGKAEKRRKKREKKKERKGKKKEKRKTKKQKIKGSVQTQAIEGIVFKTFHRSALTCLDFYHQIDY